MHFCHIPHCAKWYRKYWLREVFDRVYMQLDTHRHVLTWTPRTHARMPEDIKIILSCWNEKDDYRLWWCNKYNDNVHASGNKMNSNNKHGCKNNCIMLTCCVVPHTWPWPRSQRCKPRLWGQAIMADWWNDATRDTCSAGTPMSDKDRGARGFLGGCSLCCSSVWLQGCSETFPRSWIHLLP